MNQADKLFNTYLTYLEKKGINPALDESARKLLNAMREHLISSLGSIPPERF